MLQDTFLDWLWRLGEPVQIGSGLSNIPPVFERLSRQCAKAEVALCAPLSTKQHLVGLLLLGRKTRGDYHQSDLDLLATLCNHAALAIQSHQTQEELRETRAFESFARLSSFIVHDLRNVLSILAMAAQNAKVNMHDEDFRHNLAETLTTSVVKMREILSRLTLNPDSVEISWQEVRVDLLISELLHELSVPEAIAVVSDAVPGIIASSDKTQLKRVLQNLVLNAIAAVREDGRIAIGAVTLPNTAIPEFREKWPATPAVEITVRDNGCGMSSEFIARKLFRPFQTTKRNGLGIGLYQCKEIVGALGGVIWADSQEEGGTTFHILLPQPTQFPDSGSDRSNGAQVSAAQAERRER